MRTGAWLTVVATGIGAPTFVLRDMREFTNLGPDARGWLALEVAAAGG